MDRSTLEPPLTAQEFDDAIAIQISRIRAYVRGKIAGLGDNNSLHLMIKECDQLEVLRDIAAVIDRGKSVEGLNAQFNTVN